MSDVKNVLVLEDEMIVAMDVEETLRDRGAGKISPVDTYAYALEWPQSQEQRVTIVDPRLKDGYCHPVVRRPIEMNAPFIAYSSDPDSGVFHE